MTQKEFITRTHFMTDIGEVFPRQTRYRDDGAEVIPATSSRQHDSAVALFKLVCAGLRAPKPVAVKDDSLSRLDRAIADLERRRKLEPPMTNAPCPSPWEMASQWRREYEAREAQVCAEAKAAYDARNPHKRKGAGR